MRRGWETYRTSRHGYCTEDVPALRGLLDGYLAGLSESLADSPVAERVVALMLSGGYGRGEGGVFRDEDGSPRLYNDLEFYLVVDRRETVEPATAWARHEAETGEHAVGIEVEFKVVTATELLDATPSMFYYDLLAAHEWIAGDAAFPERLPDTLRDNRAIPLHEASRLLFNRGSGLLFSRLALASGDERTRNGFVERNHAKVKLALGDAVLCARGDYHFSCRERARRVADMTPTDVPGAWPEVARLHAEGVAFKLRPRHASPPQEVLIQNQNTLTRLWLEVFLWLESRRLGQQFDNPMHYARWQGRIYPETPTWKNAALRVRDFLKYRTFLPHPTDYPRGALHRALAAVLGSHDVVPHAAYRQLPGHFPHTPAEFESQFRKWWGRYN